MKYLSFACVILFISCTDNANARKFGGKEEVKLRQNEKLINVTWKGSNIWLLTEDTITHKKYFREKSSLGLLEGEITFK